MSELEVLVNGLAKHNRNDAAVTMAKPGNMGTRSEQAESVNNVAVTDKSEVHMTCVSATSESLRSKLILLTTLFASVGPLNTKLAFRPAGANVRVTTNVFIENDSSLEKSLNSGIEIDFAVCVHENT